MPPLAASSHKLSVLGGTLFALPQFRDEETEVLCAQSCCGGPTKNHVTCVSKPRPAAARPELCSVSQSLEEKALRPC